MHYWFALAAPLVLLGVLIMLERVEDAVVGPTDRAAEIIKIVETSPPDEVERRVAQLLAPLANKRARQPEDAPTRVAISS